jgi:hypothetical protein
MTLKIKGLKEFQRKLDDLSASAKKISGTRSVPVAELLTPVFLSKCSRFKSAEEFFEASGFTVASQKDLKAIPEDQWDDFIKKNTSYSNWQAMLNAATEAWGKRGLHLQ